MRMTQKGALAETTRQLGNARDTLKTSKNKAVLTATANKIDYLTAVQAALRGPTREMVERMFPGCEVCKNAKYVTGSVSAVAPYDDQHETETYAEGDFDFCPNCGRPLADEAMGMILERWKEALENA